MRFLKPFSFSIFFLAAFFFASTHEADVIVQNNCPYTVWAAAAGSNGGGKQLEPGEPWFITVPPGSTGSRIWARTNCIFDEAGRGKCETGDCDGLLECKGFEFSPVSSGCNSATRTRSIKCTADINGQCPNELKAPGGCNHPCTVFNTSEYCCNSGTCGPTNYSRFFKDRCPNAYSYPQDDATSTFTCPGGTNYMVVFCPRTTTLITNNMKVTYNLGHPNSKHFQPWFITVPPGSTGSRIWARTNCIFDEAGRGKCETGDCDGLLECKGYGSPPNTLIEYAFNQFNNMDFFDISLVDGFNVPVEFNAVSSGCNNGTRTRSIKCTADINQQCPVELRAPGGCNNACTVFQTDEYCCISGPSNCNSTNYSRFFKNRCPDAYSYSYDDQNSIFTYPGGTNYMVVFCPRTSTSTNLKTTYYLVCT
ncbi:hypothetical protein F0562_013268 [Nyssa sinensis]|uniref:Thaumatin-like protein n=1 Tax=Nyssa sinensis TaxID=561372 RepID=A0A5J4ZZ48_9ASTE|nr:hypothetical protein F0562_013268 [Nyssa sinensis]